MTLNAMQHTLSLDSIPSAFTELFHRIEHIWEEKAAHILSEDYIRTSHSLPLQLSCL